MSIDMMLIIGAVVIGVAYFAKRNHRRQLELKAQERRAR
jgi:hypothetical protein